MKQRTNQPVDEHLITPEQAANLLGMDLTWRDPHREVLRMARRGLLVGVRVGRHVRILPSSVSAYIAGQRVTVGRP